MDSIQSLISGLAENSLSSTDSFSGILIALGSAYLGGILASLTPCVYPMIPITLSVVGGLGTGRERNWRALLTRSSLYILGMALTYSFLGVLAGLTGRIFGTLTNNRNGYLLVATVLVMSSLIMMEVIPFDPLAWIERLRNPSDRQHPHKKEMNWLGAISLGASSGLIAAPCTTPVLTAILSYIANTQSISLGLGLMFFFSLGLGTLLLALSIFAGLFQILPKSGSWMKHLKTISGILLLVFSCYLFYRAGEVGQKL